MEGESASVDTYRALFNPIGPALLVENINAIGPLTPLYVLDDEARYYFSSSISATPFTFVVTLERENGLWKVRNF